MSLCETWSTCCPLWKAWRRVACACLRELAGVRARTSAVIRENVARDKQALGKWGSTREAVCEAEAAELAERAAMFARDPMRLRAMKDGGSS